MNLCLFQGTFNPIHNAHLALAEYVVENNYADKIIFIPAYIPPHKSVSNDLSVHRLNMLKLATAYNPQFDVSDIEYQRQGISYTYLTVCEIIELFNINGKIKFIIGTDAFRNIENWYKADKLKEKVHFLIFVRDKNFNKNEFDFLISKGFDFEFMSLDFNDISSTDLRKNIANGIFPSEQIPQSVKEYIIENKLYKS